MVWGSAEFGALWPAEPISLPQAIIQSSRHVPKSKAAAAAAIPGRKPKRKQTSASALAPAERLLQKWGCARAAPKAALVEAMQAEATALQAAAQVAAHSIQPSRTWLEAVPPEEVGHKITWKTLQRALPVSVCAAKTCPISTISLGFTNTKLAVTQCCCLSAWSSVLAQPRSHQLKNKPLSLPMPCQRVASLLDQEHWGKS